MRDRRVGSSLSLDGDRAGGGDAGAAIGGGGQDVLRGGGWGDGRRSRGGNDSYPLTDGHCSGVGGRPGERSGVAAGDAGGRGEKRRCGSRRLHRDRGGRGGGPAVACRCQSVFGSGGWGYRRRSGGRNGADARSDRNRSGVGGGPGQRRWISGDDAGWSGGEARRRRGRHVEIDGGEGRMAALVPLLDDGVVIARTQTQLSIDLGCSMGAVHLDIVDIDAHGAKAEGAGGRRTCSDVLHW